MFGGMTILSVRQDHMPPLSPCGRLVRAVPLFLSPPVIAAGYLLDGVFLGAGCNYLASRYGY